MQKFTILLIVYMHDLCQLSVRNNPHVFYVTWRLWRQIKLHFGYGTITFWSCFSHCSIGILCKHNRFKLSVSLNHMQSSMYIHVQQHHLRQISDLIYVSARLVLPSDQYKKKLKPFWIFHRYIQVTFTNKLTIFFTP